MDKIKQIIKLSAVTHWGVAFDESKTDSTWAYVGYRNAVAFECSERALLQYTLYNKNFL